MLGKIIAAIFFPVAVERLAPIAAPYPEIFPVEAAQFVVGAEIDKGAGLAEEVDSQRIVDIRQVEQSHKGRINIDLPAQGIDLLRFLQSARHVNDQGDVMVGKRHVVNRGDVGAVVGQKQEDGILIPRLAGHRAEKLTDRPVGIFHDLLLDIPAARPEGNALRDHVRAVIAGGQVHRQERGIALGKAFQVRQGKLQHEVIRHPQGGQHLVCRIVLLADNLLKPVIA